MEQMIHTGKLRTRVVPSPEVRELELARTCPLRIVRDWIWFRYDDEMRRGTGGEVAH